MIQPVTFIGAGPGHSDYLTLKGARALQSCEVCLYDALIEFETFRPLIPDTTQLIPVGKRCGAHSRTQSEISAILVEMAKSGHKVVRLKGGDPAIFGRLGEEMRALKEANLEWEIIPGVSSLGAAAADFSLPLTLRSVSDCLCIINGHGLEKKDPAYLYQLAHYPGTIAVFMGAKKHREICTALLNAGAAAELPVRIVENAGRSNARVYEFSLGQAAVAGDPRINGGPALLLMGYSLDADINEKIADTLNSKEILF